MDSTHSLSLQQVDTINLSLDKSLAVARMVAECGSAARPAPDDLPPVASLFMVMQVIVDELEKIEEVMSSLRSGPGMPVG
ncbi:hypothetical protein SIID45300_00435 [Candidatus Magnetaquicoccaceae bacterium FCR-1]|uniref:Uncharacterized protein n=1 Tax=Candidatus Magnetaquiglobus chichijimensis TaxID=3141448 RepID=A0ABQ0C5G5_9PROT